MSRPSRGMEGLVGGACKIRKRGSSSSSASSLLQNSRFKRAILVGRRGGTSTPVPSWKMNAMSPCSTAGASECSQYPPSHFSGKGKQAPVSARKLATALWELNEIPSPQMRVDSQGTRSKKEAGGRDRAPRLALSGSLPPHLSDPSHSPVSDRMDRSGSGSRRRRMPVMSHKLRFNELNHRVLDSVSYGSLMETETCSRGVTPTSSVMGAKSRLKDLSNGLTTSKELLKILNRIWGLEEQHSSSVSLFSALRAELERARVQVEQLIEEEGSDRNEITYLKKRFMEEKSAWKSKEKERIKAVVQSVVEELELEKKLRRRTERLNEKLGGQLTDTKSALARATKELENERRSREIVEQVCDELVRGIGEDKAEAEEMKRESAKAREELEKEREMLQLADVWREERVQMKLSEAKYQFEEKNAAVDQLRNELETFLATKRSEETRSLCGNHASSLEVEDPGQLVHPCRSHMGNDVNADGMNEDGEVENGEDGGEQDEEVDSVDSDLHSIELNMDNNSRSYCWSYATGAVHGDMVLASSEEISKKRSSNCEKVSRGSFSLERGMSEDIARNFSNRDLLRKGDSLDLGRLSASSSLAEKRSLKLDPDAERYKSIKGLRDHLLTGSRISSARGLASPTRQWIQPVRPVDDHDQVFEGSKVAEMVKVTRESGSTARTAGSKGGNLNSRHKQLLVVSKQ